ncbi:facilitated trehalose transporter Tret1-like [Achroia grisella]|uniref:facilitated trehalose transporter Tret1-like n=1 Tax=Achroia grisella TaxID=688607 RepID=UPI0027D3184C|nr:facilitated trehalose transporter Tret1-like [Achroia grisella]
MGQGLVLGYPTLLIAALDSPINSDLTSMSWLAASFGPSTMTGVILASFCMDWLGRKSAFLLLILPGTTGLLIMYFAQSYLPLLIGRVLSGITTGGTYTVGVVTIAECVHPKYRCMYLNLKTASFTLGTAILQGLGDYIHWRSAAIVILIPHVMSLVMASMWIESPAWFASKKRFDECEAAFFWIRGKSDSSKTELNEVMKAQNCPTKAKTKSIVGLLETITRKDFLKPLLISTIAAIVMEASVSTNILSNDRPWVAIALLIVYFFLANLGCNPIPLALLAEVFPLEHKMIGNIAIGAISSMIIMVSLKVTPYLLADIKTYGTFVIYGTITLIGLLILYFIMPETKDRTMQEIENYFGGGRSRNNNENEMENEANRKIIENQ